jgi:hypothetical protein
MHIAFFTFLDRRQRSEGLGAEWQQACPEVNLLFVNATLMSCRSKFLTSELCLIFKGSVSCLYVLALPCVLLIWQQHYLVYFQTSYEYRPFGLHCVHEPKGHTCAWRGTAFRWLQFGTAARQILGIPTCNCGALKWATMQFCQASQQGRQSSSTRRYDATRNPSMLTISFWRRHVFKTSLSAFRIWADLWRAASARPRVTACSNFWHSSLKCIGGTIAGRFSPTPPVSAGLHLLTSPSSGGIHSRIHFFFWQSQLRACNNLTRWERKTSRDYAIIGWVSPGLFLITSRC